MRQRFRVLLPLLLLLCAFGCQKAPEQQADPRWPVTVREAVIEKIPRRVVTLSPAATDMVVELGYGGRLAGVSDYCETPAHWESQNAAEPPCCPTPVRFSPFRPTL